MLSAPTLKNSIFLAVEAEPPDSMRQHHRPPEIPYAIFNRATLTILLLTAMVIFLSMGAKQKNMAWGGNIDRKPGISIRVAETKPENIVTGQVSGIDNPDEVRIVVFIQTNRWYAQPYEDNRAYLPINRAGTFKTWVRDWRQISAFVIRNGYNALAEQDPYGQFPLRIDNKNVLACTSLPAIKFSGREWAIRAGDELDPGIHDFSSANVSVDGQGRLHLKTTFREGKWRCAQVSLMQPLGYGTYTFHLVGRVDQLDKYVVASPFLYADTKKKEDKLEFDVEFARWGDEFGPNAQFVLQPFTVSGHRERFFLTLSQEYSTHVIRWTANSISFRSSQGLTQTPAPQDIAHEWTIGGEKVPKDGDKLLVNLSLWVLTDKNPAKEEELIVESFEWQPL